MTNFITCERGSKRRPERCDHCLNCQSSDSHNVDGVNLVCDWCGGISGAATTVYETPTHRITRTVGSTGRRFLDVYPLGSDVCGDGFYKAETDTSITLHCHLLRSMSHDRHEAIAVLGSYVSLSVSWGNGVPRIIDKLKAEHSDPEDYEMHGDESDDFPFGKW